ncbi:MAG: hypothetical protein ABSH11_11235 [Verrucomicrobiota bacterium]|jgi:hypothetical protein
MTAPVANATLKKRKLPFAAEKDAAELQREHVILLIKVFDARRTQHIPAENLLVFCHGRSWNFQQQGNTGYKPHEGQMELKSSTITIALDRILANDISIVFEFIRDISMAFEQHLVGDLFNEMQTVAKETGNTISIPKEGITGEAFLEMIRRTQVLVGNDGKVSRPSLFLAPGMIEKLQHDLESLGPEFKVKVDALWAEKEKEALEMEAERLAKYDQSG